MAKSQAPLKQVWPATVEPKPRRRKLEPKRESAADIAARIRKNRKPAKHRIFQETVKRAGDVVISNVGRP